MLFKNCLSTFLFHDVFPFLCICYLLLSWLVSSSYSFHLWTRSLWFFLLGSPMINIYYHWCLTFILICEVILITANNHCEVLGYITCIIPLNSHNKLMNYLLSLFYWWNSERLGTSQNWHLNLGASIPESMFLTQCSEKDCRHRRDWLPDFPSHLFISAIQGISHRKSYSWASPSQSSNQCLGWSQWLWVGANPYFCCEIIQSYTMYGSLSLNNSL